MYYQISPVKSFADVAEIRGMEKPMKEKVKKLCLDCNHRCEDLAQCDFRPRKDLLSINKQHVHPEEALNKKKNSEVCVICKTVVQDYLWAKLQKGYYSFCPKCHKRHLWVAQNVKSLQTVS